MMPWNAVRDNTRPPDLQIPHNHVWTWLKKLGAGGEATAHLWAHVDANQKVVRRVVIRNTDVRPSQRFKDGPHKGEWIELYIQQRLVPSGSTEAFTVPILAASKIPGTLEGWRTYMDYFGKGDLYAVISAHGSTRPLPEPFLWFTFHRLAKALVAMDTVFREEGKDGPVVIHKDLKPPNILMGNPGSLGRDSNYISYPPAYLGDFGFAYLTSDDEKVWKRANLTGTVGYFPPESAPGIVPENERVPPTSQSNVWQVGATILAAMTAKEPDSTESKDQRRYTVKPKYEKLIEDKSWSGYSQDLINLVEDCLRMEMEDRPSPQELLNMVEDYMPMYAEGMDRWGTLSWVKQKSSEIDGPLVADDDAHIDTDAGTGTATGEKRKATEPLGSPPDAKRIKAETALTRRLAYVASVIKGIRPVPKPHEDDQDFKLGWRKRMVYKVVDAMFDPDTFFETADPGPIDYLKLGTVDRNRLGVVLVDDDDDDDDGDDDEDGKDDKAKSLPPITPAKPKKPIKGAGTSVDPYMLFSSPAKPTPAKPVAAKPAPDKPAPDKSAPAEPTKPHSPGVKFHSNDLFSTHWSSGYE